MDSSARSASTELLALKRQAGAVLEPEAVKTLQAREFEIAAVADSMPSAESAWPCLRERPAAYFELAKPREALGQAGAAEQKGWDPRLSPRGNRVSKQLAVLLDRLAWVENFLECHATPLTLEAMSS
jgi:hypothetical protein